jgi:hypothetical protein
MGDPDAYNCQEWQQERFMKQEVRERLTQSTQFYRDLEERAERHKKEQAEAVERMERRSLEEREDRAYLIVFGLVTLGIMIGLGYKLWSML